MRALRLLRAAYGAALVAAPIRVVQVSGGSATDDVALFAARALGARHVVQALLTGDHPGPIRRTTGALVDALHAATMFAVAATDSARRRPALLDGSVATAFCLAGLTANPHRRRTSIPLGGEVEHRVGVDGAFGVVG